jgi:uncharacterized protein YcfJ
MHAKLKYAFAAAALALASQAMAQITLYEAPGFNGRSVTIDRPVRDLGREGFNDRASSLVIDHGRWEVCEHNRFEGRCIVLRRGRYDNLREMGMNNQISSVRPADERRRYRNEYDSPAAVMSPPGPPPDTGWRRRPEERIYDVPVTSVRAIVGPPNQRCWVERQQVAPAGQPNVGGAVVGGLIGGILGHQIGGGSGRDAATAGGVIAGAAIGANTGGGSTSGGGYQDVQRCQNVGNVTPAYYDVTYVWRGVEHHVQMSAPPGPRIMVNESGEPRT